EKIFAGAFTDRSISRQRDAFRKSQAFRFSADELAGEIIPAGFRQRGYGIWRNALPAGDADVDTLLEPVGAQVRTPFPCRNCNVDRVVRLRSEADVAVSAHCYRSNVGAVHQVVRNYDVLADAAQLVAAVRDRHAIDFCRIQEALHMIVQPEDFRSARSLVHAY